MSISRLNNSGRRAFAIVVAAFVMTTLACGSLTFGSSPDAPGGAQAPTATRESSIPPTWPPTWTPTSSPTPVADSSTPALAITLTPTAASTIASAPTEQATPEAENPFEDMPLDIGWKCDDDFEGLVEASRDCRPAEAVCSGTMNMMGVIVSSVTRYEIRGMEAGKCVLSQRTEDFDLHYSEEVIQQMLDGGATREEIQTSEQAAREQSRAATVGLEQICRFGNTDDLTLLLDRLSEGSFSTSDWEVAECETIPPAGQ